MSIETTKPCAERLALLDQITLARGGHEDVDPPHGECCLVEAASWLRCAVSPSDHDETVSPVIAAFSRSWNDAIDDDTTRTRLLLPLAPLLIGTATTEADEETRVWMCTDWLVRVNAPAFMDLNPSLRDHAAALRTLPVLTSNKIAVGVQATIEAARSASVAVSTAAVAAVSTAVWTAASVAATAAVNAAAWNATRAATKVTAWHAASTAAWNATRATLNATVATLQLSAVDLVRAMCAVGRTHD